MKKIKTSRGKKAKTLSETKLPVADDEQKIAQEEHARIYRESVMHQRIDSEKAPA